MRNNLMPAPIWLIFALIFAAQIAVCQDSSSHRTVGFSASLQDNQVDILIPIWLGSQFSLSPALGIVSTQGVGTDLHIGLIPRYYFSTEKVAPYIGLRVAMLQTLPSPGTTDWLVGAAFGGEYFVDRHFSTGIESQFNLTISDPNSSRFGNPGKKNLNSAVAAFATIYF